MKDKELRDLIINRCVADIRKEGVRWRWNFWRLFFPENREILDEILNRILSWINAKSQCLVGIETNGELLAGILSYKYLKESTRKKFAVLRPSTIPIIKPRIAPSENVTLLDDASVTGTTVNIGKDTIELGYKAKVIDTIAIASLDPIPPNFDVTTKEHIYNFDFEKLKSKVRFIIGSTIPPDVGSGEIRYDGNPSAQSFGTSAKLANEELVRSMCAKVKDGKIHSWSSWKIFADPLVFSAISQHLAQSCLQYSCNLVLSLSVWAHPFAAVVSYLTQLPLVVVRDWSQWSLRPALNSFPNAKNLFVLDTVYSTGSKLGLLSNSGLLESDRDYFFQPIFYFGKEKLLKTKINIPLRLLDPLYQIDIES
jgi:adenine/guanine phosphoribosyltransferase-like PRPP-binding protein